MLGIHKKQNMKVMQIFVSGNDYSNAKISVKGLGEVVIKDCISKETREQIYKEVTMVLKQKMGQQ